MLDTLSRWKRKATSLSPFSAQPTVSATPHGEAETWPSNAHRRADVAQLTISQPIPRSSPGSLSGFDTISPGRDLNVPVHLGSSSGASAGPGIGGGFGSGTLTPQAPYWQHLSLYGSSTGTSHSNSGSPASVGGAVRDKPPNVSWLSSSNEVEDNKLVGGLSRRRFGSGSSSILTTQPYDSQSQPQPPQQGQHENLAPAVIRLDSGSPQHEDDDFPPSSQAYGAQSGAGQKGSLRLQTNVLPPGPGAVQGPVVLYANSTLNHSAPSLRLPTNPNNPPASTSTGLGVPALSTDVYANAYGYPMAKQLSPIAEQDYVSPSDSLRKARSILESISRNESPDSGSGVGSTTGNVGTVIGSSPGTGTGTGTGEAEGTGAVGRASWPSTSEDSPRLTGPAAAAGGVSHHADVSLGSASVGTPHSHHGHSGATASIGSEITRPSLIYSSPFITRPLNRTASQTSSRTHTTNSTNTLPPTLGGAPSSTGRQAGVKLSTPTPTSVNSSEPPTIPPLDLRPHFPGPHPSHVGPGPPLRPKRDKAKAGPKIMPKIPGSHEGYYDEIEIDGGGGESEVVDEEMMMYESGMTDDQLSLHAESYVTASDRGGMEGRETVRYADEVRGRYKMDDSAAAGPSNAGNRAGIVIDVEYVDEDIEAGREEGYDGSDPSQLPSASESFITRRWEQVNISGLPTNGRMRRSVTIFKAKKRQSFVNLTPGFCAFWLGFVCPVLWLVGGWHFTSFGEQPPKMSVWEFYFNAGFWKEICCCCLARRKAFITHARGKGKDIATGMRGRKRDKGESIRAAKMYPPLPRWVAEKQSTDDGRARLNDPKRTLKGISFGYPFIARPPTMTFRRSVLGRLTGRVLNILGKPNRLLDQLYGVRLKEVRGRPESGRRMFDPWVQRCRYAFCYTLLLVAIGLCTASTYLIVFNTRELR